MTMESRVDWKLLISVVAVFLGSGVVWKIADIYNSGRPPRFTVSAINTLGGSNTYEITDHFIGVGPTDTYTATWGLEVIPHYNGNRAYGEMRVLVKDADGNVVAENKWANFDRDSKPLAVALDPYQLSSRVEKIGWYGGFQDNIFETGSFEYPEAVFDVEIVQASRLNSPLSEDKLTIKNAPWYHYAAVSAWHDDSIDVFVYGRNLGDPSDFFVVIEVFEITEVPGQAWDN